MDPLSHALRDHWDKTWDRLVSEEPLFGQLSWVELVRALNEDLAELKAKDEMAWKAIVFANNASQFHKLKTGKKISPKHYLNAKQYRKARAAGKCDICEKPVSGADAHVDHNHKTGTIRGLLCGRCNTSLERVEVDPLWGRRAFLYLAKHNEHVNQTINNDLTK